MLRTSIWSFNASRQHYERPLQPSSQWNIYIHVWPIYTYMYGVSCCKSLNSLNDKTPSLKYTFSVSAKRNKFFKSSPTLPPLPPVLKRKEKQQNETANQYKTLLLLTLKTRNQWMICFYGYCWNTNKQWKLIKRI